MLQAKKMPSPPTVTANIMGVLKPQAQPQYTTEAQSAEGLPPLEQKTQHSNLRVKSACVHPPTATSMAARVSSSPTGALRDTYERVTVSFTLECNHFAVAHLKKALRNDKGALRIALRVLVGEAITQAVLRITGRNWPFRVIKGSVRDA